MRMGMLCAFMGAGMADVCAQPADGMDVRAVAGHGANGQLASRSAFEVENDAGRHRLDVFFLEAGCCALVASDKTSLAGINAVLKTGAGGVHQDLLKVDPLL